MNTQTRLMGDATERVPPYANTPIILIAVYVAAVLAADTLAAQGVRFVIDWRMFQWRMANGFDGFKFAAWFAVPFLWSVPRMDWGYFGVRRWRRMDGILLPAGMAIGLLAILVIPLVPSLRGYYAGMGQMSTTDKWHYAGFQACWTLSWLTGWEFLHRYVLLTRAAGRWPRYGWLLVPLSEGLYHLQKPPLETVGMVVFSVLACRWTLSRRNVLLPFLVHLSIEVMLIGYLLAAP